MEERNVEETLGFLEEHGLPYVCVDMPQGFDSSLPPIAAATADDLAMVRFHGRDQKAWESKSETASERFRYDYSRDELAEWVPKVRELSGQVGETHVLMNNCYRDFAVRSARSSETCSTSISPSEAACASGSRGTLVGDGWKRIALESRDGAGHPALRQTSWFVIVGLYVWIRYEDLTRMLVEPTEAATIAVLAAILFFGSVLLHEAAHAVMARSIDLPVSGITLVFWGGATEKASAKGPLGEFLVAFVGPATTLALAGVFRVGEILTNGLVADTMSSSPSSA